jgi:hypothetical protein
MWIRTKVEGSVGHRIVRLVNGQGKIYGTIDEEGKVPRKHVRWSKHFFRKYNGWANDECHLLLAEHLGVTLVRVVDDEKRQTWQTPLGSFLSGRGISYFPHGAQRVVPIKFWTQLMGAG